MKNRYSPSSNKIEQLKKNAKGMKGKGKSSSSSTASVAHQEANELLTYLTEKRLKSKENNINNNNNENIDNDYDTSNNENMNTSTIADIKNSQLFDWELIKGDKEWHKPYLLDSKEWQVMPLNQQYNRNEWFYKYNESEIQSLRHKSRVSKHIYKLTCLNFFRLLFNNI